MSTLEVTNKNFQETLEQNEIVLLDFWASWCGPCKAFAPVFEKVSKAHPEVIFGKVNTEEQDQLSATFQIRSIPTIMAFRQNILLFVQPGALPESALEEIIAKIKSLDMEKVKKDIEDESSAKTKKELT